MYLIDKDIKTKKESGEINFECSNEKFPFEDSQIQPCSVDLRLDNIFWKSKSKLVNIFCIFWKSKNKIDLRKSALSEISPRRNWKEISLGENEYIEIKPGEFVLGRVYEKFKMPSSIAGKIEGRSSFGRLGLGVQIGCDFINPGWVGHMPLQIVNFSKTTIRIYPFIPICQLILIQLSGEPDQTYGNAVLQSKYMDDDGGPSYWWRDNRIRKLQDMFQGKSIDLRIQEDIFRKLGVDNPDIIDRFEKFAEKLELKYFSSATSVLDKFTKKEKFKQRLEMIYMYSPKAIFGILITISIGYYFSTKKIIPTYFNISLLICDVVFLCLAICLIFYDKKEFLTPEEFDRKKSKTK